MPTQVSVETLCAWVIADLVVGGACEGKRDRSHERSVAVVTLAREARTTLERKNRGVADIEQPVTGVGIVTVPGNEASPNVVRVNTSELTIAVAYGERHRGVIAPGARRLVVGAVANHV